MKKRDIVKSKILFNNIIQNGNRIANRFYVICYTSKNELNSNYGFAVGKKIGKAVVRNKIKRQLRNIVTDNKQLFPNYKNYIIMCKNEILNLKYQEMEKELIKLLKEIK